MPRVRPIMSIGVALPAGDADDAVNIIDTLIEHTAQAAAAGVDVVWFSQALSHDAITLAALAGRAVPGVAVGTSVVPIYPRHPLLLAGLAQTAQAATGGRFTLGLGLGARSLLEPAFGIEYPPPIRHLREHLLALRPLLTGTNPDFDGQTLTSHPPLSTEVAGASPPSPVVVAAMGPQALRVAGELADGTVPFLAGPRTLAEQIVPTITEAARAAGGPAPRIIAGIPAVVTSEVDAVRETVAGATAFYDSVPSYQKVIATEGLASAAELAVVGSEESVAATVRRYFDAGATEVLFTQTGLGGSQDRLRTWELAGELARAGR